MLYQATRHFGDFENGIEIPYGGYVDTECIKWVQRFGPILRPLNPGEAVKGTVTVVKDMIEDIVSVIVKQEVEEVVDLKVVEEPVIVETTPLRRKIKPPVSPA